MGGRAFESRWECAVEQQQAGGFEKENARARAKARASGMYRKVSSASEAAKRELEPGAVSFLRLEPVNNSFGQGGSPQAVHKQNTFCSIC